MPSAPIPKNTPSKLRFAPFDVLMSDTTALVAPLITPAHNPKIKTQIFNNEKDEAYAIPSNPADMPIQEIVNNNLYP